MCVCVCYNITEKRNWECSKQNKNCHLFTVANKRFSRYIVWEVP